MEVFLGICRVFLWLVIYSAVGWLYESVLCSVTAHKWVNRGFLNGPFCPIYGFGALLVIAVFHDKSTGIVELFLTAAVLTNTLEYMTSYILEKLFHTRWWDYSGYRFQLNGRVCLLGFLAFGFMSVLVIKWVHPFVSGLTDRIPDGWTIAVSVLLFAVLMTDLFITVRGILKLNNKLAEIQTALDHFQKECKVRLEEWKETTDSRRTSFFTKQKELFESSRFYSAHIHELLSKRKIQDRRLFHAFPKMHSIKYKDALEHLKENMKNKKKK